MIKLVNMAYKPKKKCMYCFCDRLFMVYLFIILMISLLKSNPQFINVNKQHSYLLFYILAFLQLPSTFCGTAIKG